MRHRQRATRYFSEAAACPYNGHLPVVERLLADPRVDPSAGDNAALLRAIQQCRIPVISRLCLVPCVIHGLSSPLALPVEYADKIRADFSAIPLNLLAAAWKRGGRTSSSATPPLPCGTRVAGSLRSRRPTLRRRHCSPPPEFTPAAAVPR